MYICKPPRSTCMIWVCLNMADSRVFSVFLFPKERVAVYKDYDAAFKFLIEARCPVAMEMKLQGKSTINSGAPIEHGHL